MTERLHAHSWMTTAAATLGRATEKFRTWSSAVRGDQSPVSPQATGRPRSQTATAGQAWTDTGVLFRYSCGCT